jgi:lysophospholipase L1-like esterase
VLGAGWSERTPGGWLASYSVAVSQVTAPVYAGMYAYRLDYSRWGAFVLRHADFDLRPGLSFAVRGTVTGQRLEVYADGASLGAVAPPVGAWLPVTLPSSDASVTELTWKEAGSAQGTVYLDEIGVQGAALPPTPTANATPGPVTTQTPTATPGAPLRVMPLGDSNTEGLEGGYRPPLYGLLSPAPDFVGPKQDGYAYLPDRDHAGYGGYTIGGLLAEAPAWVAAHDPDVILLLIGTNDLAWWYVEGIPTTIARYGQLLDALHSAAPDARIVVGTLPPMTGANQQGTSREALGQQFNAELPALVAARPYARLADHHAALDAALHLRDAVHLNTPGYGVMAGVWERVVEGP